MFLGSQDEFAMAQFFVHLPSEPRHVQLPEAEPLSQGQAFAILKYKGSTVAVIVLTTNIHFEKAIPSIQKISSIFLDCLCLEILKNMLGAASVERPLGVEVGDGSARDVDADQRPVDLQVDRDQQQLLLEDIHILGPSLYSIVAFCSQFIVEKAVEEVDLFWYRVHDQVSIHVHDLVIEPVLSVQRAQVVHGEDVPFVVDPEAFGQRAPRRALERLHQVLDHGFPVWLREALTENRL